MLSSSDSFSTNLTSFTIEAVIHIEYTQDELADLTLVCNLNTELSIRTWTNLQETKSQSRDNLVYK